MQVNNNGSIQFRVVLIGESSVGKTCLVNRFIRNNFNTVEPNTIGVIYDTYYEKRDGVNIEVQIWDTAGQEKFRSLGPAYYRSASAAIVVFDMTKLSTFESLQGWVDQFKTHSIDDSITIIVGNKVDLVEHIAISEEYAREWALTRGNQFFKVSAKTGEGVNVVFSSLVDLLMSKNRDNSSRGIRQQAKPYVESTDDTPCVC